MKKCVDGGKDLNPHFIHILAPSAFICCSYFICCVLLCADVALFRRFFHRLVFKCILKHSCPRHYLWHQVLKSRLSFLQSKMNNCKVYGTILLYSKPLQLLKDIEHFPAAYSANIHVHFSSGLTTSTLQPHLRRKV